MYATKQAIPFTIDHLVGSNGLPSRTRTVLCSVADSLLTHSHWRARMRAQYTQGWGLDAPEGVMHALT
jgi:hypothetical protein